MIGQTIILRRDRRPAYNLLAKAPDGAVVNIRPAARTLHQNDKLWALLSDVSRAMPDGRKHPPEVWKALFMNAAGYPVQFETGLSGEPFPIGFRSSRLTKVQMSELIEFIHSWCAENGVRLSDEQEAA